MNILPKVFFEEVQGSILSGDFLVLVKGDWCRFILETSYAETEFNHAFHVVYLTGKLVPNNDEEDFSGLGESQTVLRIGNRDVPCSIGFVSIGADNSRHHDSMGGVHYFTVRRDITVCLAVRYRLYDYTHGDITNTVDDIPPELTRMIEVEKNPRKKTVFDILDLD